MKSYTITVSDAIGTEAVNALAHQQGWTATVSDPANPGATIPNPVTKGQAAEAGLAELLRDAIRRYRRYQADVADAGGTSINVTVVGG
jgi:hypothetical protein